jgi:hypothetical protein
MKKHIFAVIDQLTAEGENPTPAAVRRTLGGSGFTQKDRQECAFVYCLAQVLLLTEN